jgi:protein gp37
MGARTAIEWSESTWNPTVGCTKVSPGCDHCYAERITERFHGPGSFANVVLHPDRLELPLRWRKPRRVFVNSMSDLFHDDVPDEYIGRVFAVMAAAPRHTFQVLTKRHARMRALMRSGEFFALVSDHAIEALGMDVLPWPLPNVWLGVSVEDQHWADIRIPALLDTPAVVRFLSAEPLLGPIDLTRWLAGRCRYCDGIVIDDTDGRCTGGDIGWVIVGGESGSGARPMHPEWARNLRDQCVAAGVPFLFKQWGEWTQRVNIVEADHCPVQYVDADSVGPDADERMWRVGKKRAGRELDGRTWDEYPA